MIITEKRRIKFGKEYNRPISKLTNF